MGKYLARGHGMVRHDQEPNIFPSVRPNLLHDVFALITSPLKNSIKNVYRILLLPFSCATDFHVAESRNDATFCNKKICCMHRWLYVQHQDCNLHFGQCTVRQVMPLPHQLWTAQNGSGLRCIVWQHPLLTRQ